MEVETHEFEGRAAHRYHLASGADLLHVPCYLARDEVDELVDACKRLAWGRKPIRGVATLRANVWLTDDPKAIYKYSGQVWTPHVLPDVIRRLGGRLGSTVSEALNCALGTFYPDGRAGVGYHADDEPIFGRNPLVASISLGATRMFQIVHRSRAGKRSTPDVTLTLTSGALVVMRGSFQHEYLHALKTAAASVGHRYNLSYRRHLGGTQAPR